MSISGSFGEIKGVDPISIDQRSSFIFFPFPQREGAAYSCYLWGRNIYFQDDFEAQMAVAAPE